MYAEECPTCKGSGHPAGNSYRVCGECIGAGEIYREKAEFPTHLLRFVVVRPGGYIHSEHKTREAAERDCGETWKSAGNRIVKCLLVPVDDEL